MCDIDATIWLPATGDVVKPLSFTMSHIPRNGELISIDAVLDANTKVTKTVRVKDVHHYIKYHHDAGPPKHKVHIFTT